MNIMEIIEKKISPNQVLDNWSVAGQIRIKQYRFLGIGNSHSECYLQNPKTEKVYAVREKDFQFLYKHWKNYKDRIITRHELCDMNYSTTYAICIMHYLDENYLF